MIILESSPRPSPFLQPFHPHKEHSHNLENGSSSSCWNLNINHNEKISC